MRSKEIVQGLQEIRKTDRPVIVAGVGSGLTAKAAVAGGADMLAVYNTAVYRIRGVPTALAFLPYDNANELTLLTAPEVISNAADVPVIVGFGAHDPLISLQALVDRGQAIGADGITNEPFLGLYGRDLRAQLEAAGLGFSRELELLRTGLGRGMIALGWAFSAEEARLLAKSGVQIVGAMVGVTAGGEAGGSVSTPLDRAVERIRAMVQSAKEAGKDVIVLAHGGPLNDPDSVTTVLRRTGADGYVTGSTGERIPVEAGVTETIRQYKAIDLGSDRQ